MARMSRLRRVEDMSSGCYGELHLLIILFNTEDTGEHRVYSGRED
jgi:hypothetical protein